MGALVLRGWGTSTGKLSVLQRCLALKEQPPPPRTPTGGLVFGPGSSSQVRDPFHKVISLKDFF